MKGLYCHLQVRLLPPLDPEVLSARAAWESCSNTLEHVSHGFGYGLVSVIMPSRGIDESEYLVVANKLHHGACNYQPSAVCRSSGKEKQPQLSLAPQVPK